MIIFAHFIYNINIFLLQWRIYDGSNWKDYILFGHHADEIDICVVTIYLKLLLKDIFKGKDNLYMSF